MSARDLTDWLVDRRAALDAAGISTVHGAAPRLNEDGKTWISFSSRTAAGRLVRAVDGSSRSTARRHLDGASLINTDAPDTTRAQLETLVTALGG